MPNLKDFKGTTSCSGDTTSCPVPGARRCTFDQLTMCCSDVIMSSPVPGARRSTFDPLAMCCFDVIMSSPAPGARCQEMHIWSLTNDHVLFWRHYVQPCARCQEMRIWSADHVLLWRHYVQPCAIIVHFFSWPVTTFCFGHPIFSSVPGDAYLISWLLTSPYPTLCINRSTSAEP